MKLKTEKFGIKFLIISIFALSAYSIYVGGDAWEWWHSSTRFITPVMPLVFILLSISIIYIFNILRGLHRFIDIYYNFILSIITILLILNLNYFYGYISLQELFEISINTGIISFSLAESFDRSVVSLTVAN